MFTMKLYMSLVGLVRQIDGLRSHVLRASAIESILPLSLHRVIHATKARDEEELLIVIFNLMSRSWLMLLKTSSEQ